MNNRSFFARRVARSYRQTIFATPQVIFPLLCPERETEWLDGWQYKMIYSESGIIEQGAVFSTSLPDEPETTWIVSKYDPEMFQIEFIRFTPESRICWLKIFICETDSDRSHVDITYTYTSVSENGNDFIDRFSEESFLGSVKFWEDSLNYYLKTGKKLLHKK